MSVINKMLRDLDARRADGVLPELSREVRSTTMLGTVSVDAAQRRSRLRWLLLPGVLLAVGAAAWYWTTQVSAPVPMPAAVVSTPPVAAVMPQTAASAPDAGPGAPVATKPESVASAAVPVAEPVATMPKATRQARAAVASKPESAPVARPNKEKKELARADGEPAGSGVAGPSVAPGPAASATPIMLPPAPRRQTAVQETLTQAQNLWAAGSREAAVALLREAVAVAENAPDADAQLPPLARELARMELAQGRSGAALDLLTRLEPRLAGHSDLWAMRGNAAQRLGRHAESVQAYQRALQLRPGEQRWLLGAAVSLAALGQSESAAQYAEQARALGPVSAEVLVYLRQAGVPLR